MAVLSCHPGGKGNHGEVEIPWWISALPEIIDEKFYSTLNSLAAMQNTEFAV
jgi:hypothetical protein